MISKAKNLVRAEQLKKHFKTDQNLDLKVVLESGVFSGLSSYDPILELIAIVGFECIRIIGTKLEYCKDIGTSGSSILQIEFLNGTGFLFLSTQTKFIVYNTKDNVVKDLNIPSEHFVIYPVYNNDRITDIYAMFIQNGSISVYNVLESTKSTFTFRFDPVDCNLFKINPRNPNQLLIGFKNIVHLYDVCLLHSLVQYELEGITNGCFHPNGTQVCIANANGLSLFKREEPKSYYEHYIENIKQIAWIMDGSDYFIILTEIVTIYEHKDTLIPLKSFDSSCFCFLATNPYFNHGSSLMVHNLVSNISSDKTIPIAHTFEHDGFAFCCPTLSFITKLMHKHNDLTLETNFEIDVGNIYDAFEVLIMWKNDQIDFYQYYTCPGQLKKSIHSIKSKCTGIAFRNDLLYVFHETISIYALFDEWFELQTIPIKASFMGLDNKILAYADNLLYFIACKLPDIDEAQLDPQQHVQLHIAIKPFELPNLKHHIYERYYITATHLIRLCEDPFKDGFEEIFPLTTSKKPCVVVLDEHVFVLLEDLLIIHKEEVTSMSVDLTSLIVINSQLYGLKVTKDQLVVSNVFNGSSRTHRIPENAKIAPHLDHIWIIQNNQLNVLGSEPFFTITTKPKYVKREIAAAPITTQLYNFLFKKPEILQETEFEEDPQFYYDCLLDLKTLFSQEQLGRKSTFNKPKSQFEDVKIALQDRGEHLEELDKKFEDLEQGGKGMLEMAKALNK